MTNYRDHFDAHCGMEVVLPNGEVLRTGTGALPGAKTWQEYKYGYGPYLDGMFSQSNFGIVTKMGFWLAPEPEAFRTDTVMVYKYEDLIPLMDTMSYLSDSYIVNGHCSLASPVGRNFQNDPKLNDILAKPGGRGAPVRSAPPWGSGPYHGVN